MEKKKKRKVKKGLSLPKSEVAMNKHLTHGASPEEVPKKLMRQKTLTPYEEFKERAKGGILEKNRRKWRRKNPFR